MTLDIAELVLVHIYQSEKALLVHESVLEITFIHHYL